MRWKRRWNGPRVDPARSRPAPTVALEPTAALDTILIERDEASDELAVPSSTAEPKPTEDAPASKAAEPKRAEDAQAPPVGRPAEPRGNACLVVIRGDHVGQRYAIGDCAMTIGRVAGNDIRLGDRSVSRVHASLQPDARGVKIYDRSSKNGVLVNGRMITEARVGDGDVIEIGRSILKVLVGADLDGAYQQELLRLSATDGLAQADDERHSGATPSEQR